MTRKGARRLNQDRAGWSSTSRTLFLVVADGMGGHPRGEVAAQLTVDLLTRAFEREAAPTLVDPEGFMRDSVMAAHRAIMEYAQDENLSEPPGTTCVACVVQDGRASWVHVGDSRLYVLRGGKVASRTRDHSLMAQLVEAGYLTEAEAALRPERSIILNCLGTDGTPEPDFSEGIELARNDIVLLCSDGLWGPVVDTEIAVAFDLHDPEHALRELMDEAEFRAGRDADNLTGVAMRWGTGHDLEAGEQAVTHLLPVD